MRLCIASTRCTICTLCLGCFPTCTGWYRSSGTSLGSYLRSCFGIGRKDRRCPSSNTRIDCCLQQGCSSHRRHSSRPGWPTRCTRKIGTAQRRTRRRNCLGSHRAKRLCLSCTFRWRTGHMSPRCNCWCRFVRWQLGSCSPSGTYRHCILGCRTACGCADCAYAANEGGEGGADDAGGACVANAGGVGGAGGADGGRAVCVRAARDRAQV